MAASPEMGIQIMHPRSQPGWGRMMMAIVMTARQVCIGDGHARAERREATWYPL